MKKGLGFFIEMTDKIAYRIELIGQYVRYYFTANTEHGIHSPFVYKFITELLYDQTPYYKFSKLNKQRARLLNNETVLHIVDFGAGSLTSVGSNRKIRDIARSALSKPKFSELYFRIIEHYKSQNILELGTSLGLNAAYLAIGNSKSQVYSFEGSSTLVDISKKLFNQLKLKNVQVIEGDFEESLPSFLKERTPTLDFIFLDGNHRKKATLQYFEWLLPYCHSNSIIVFDDIRWSREMQEAWEVIKSHERVTVTIDLFFVGIVFLRTEQVKEDFVIRF